MAAEIQINILGLPEAKLAANYQVEKPNAVDPLILDLVDEGTVDLASDGTGNINMSGKGVSIGDLVFFSVNDRNGTNDATAGNAAYWVTITDDGVAPPPVLKLLAIGDSFTDRGSSGTTDGSRPTNQYVGINQSGYWVSGAYLHSTQDYIFRPDMGKSSEGTSGLLSRLDEPYVQNSDADVVILLIGTNDVGAGDINTTKQNYTDIVNKLRLNDKFKVLIVPVTHRNDGINPTSDNAFIDELNTHCVSIAATTDGVEIAAVNTEFNTRMMTDQITYGGVSDDGLHANTAGGVLLGETVAAALDTFYPSTIEKFNILPTEFTGTGGVVTAGGTGVVPDNFRGLRSNNTTEDGFTGPIDRGDGKVWWKIRTNGGVPSGSNNTTSFESVLFPCTAGWYTGEVTFEVIQGADALSDVDLRLDNDSATYSYCEQITTSGGIGAWEVGKQYRIRTPSTRCENGNARLLFTSDQDQGTDTIIYVTDFKLYKVEDVV